MHCWQLNSTLLLLLCWDLIAYHAGQDQVKPIVFVKLESAIEQDLSPGEKAELVVSFIVEEGYHIQANKVLDDNLIPTSIVTHAPSGVTVGPPVFPGPVSFQLKDMNDRMLVFHEQLDVTIPVEVSENTDRGTYGIKGNLRYQACDSVKCFFPRDLTFEIIVNVN